MESHVNQRHKENNQETELKCIVCKLICKTESEMTKHYETKHIKCIDNKVKEVSVSSKEKHTNKEQNLKCKKCNFEAKDSNAIKEHKASISHKKSNSDEEC